MRKKILEAARETEIKGEYDVLIIGGGPAGISASISAARSGARTLLVERYGFLGGMATSGMVGTFCGFFTTGPLKKKIVGGIADNILTRLKDMGGISNKVSSKINPGIATYRYNPEVFKYIADQALLSAGVELFLHMSVVDIVRKTQNNRISGVIIENKSGRFALLGKVIIDATGDGDIAFKAGAAYEFGDKKGRTQALTTMFRLTHISHATIQGINLKEVQERLTRARDTRKYDFARVDAIITPTLPLGAVSVNLCNIPDLSGVDAFDLSKAEVEGRRQVFEYLKAFRDVIPGFEKAEISSIAPHVGIRETRRILGEYLMQEDDILRGSKFEDGIALGAWPIELHNPETRSIHWKFLDKEDDYYAIPAGCIIPKNTDNLLVAGRCISTTQAANASTRVMAQAFALGEAAGIMASEAVQNKVPLREVSVKKVRDILKQRRAILEA